MAPEEVFWQASKALSSLSIGVDVSLISHATGNVLHHKVVKLKVMEPISEQSAFTDFLTANEVDIENAGFSDNIDESPHQLGMSGVEDDGDFPEIRVFLYEGQVPWHLQRLDTDDTLNLKVECSTGEEIFFKCKMDTRMEKLMSAFCSRQQVQMRNTRWTFDGASINPRQTPADLGMEDGDIIDVEIVPGGELQIVGV